jgi:hypothetical protein
MQQRLLWPRPEVRCCQVVSGSSGIGTATTSACPGATTASTSTGTCAGTGTGSGDFARGDSTAGDAAHFGE